ncbi:MAG: adaptor protein MecA [Lachnospiraceae bacterium]|nr:adaptor protein MecA [Lachnospiraceae bacterium]
MKFQKINENVVSCYITQDELIAQGVLVQDLVNDHDKATQFLKFVLKEADYAVGFNTDGKMLNVQISVLPNGSLNLMISDDENSLIQGVLSDMKTRLESFKKMMNEKNKNEAEISEDDLDQLFGPVIKGDDLDDWHIEDKEFDNFDEEMNDWNEDAYQDVVETKNPVGLPKATNDMMRISYWVEIDDMNKCVALAQDMNGMKTVPSSLYKYQGKYYLNLKLLMTKGEVVDYVCKTIEYGNQLFPESANNPLYIMEHGKEIIKVNAVETLRQLAV